MTTTIKLEEDLAREIERLRQERALSFDEIVNQVLRRGLARELSPKGIVHTMPVSLGGCLVDDLDDVSRALDIAEGEPLR